MAESDSYTTLWMWVMTGASGIITVLIGVIFKVTHAKIDENKKQFENYKDEVRDNLILYRQEVRDDFFNYKEEVKGDFMKNDRDHSEFWKLVSRVEYEKDIKRVTEMVVELKYSHEKAIEELKDLKESIIAHMAKDK